MALRAAAAAIQLLAGLGGRHVLEQLPASASHFSNSPGGCTTTFGQHVGMVRAAILGAEQVVLARLLGAEPRRRVAARHHVHLHPQSGMNRLWITSSDRIISRTGSIDRHVQLLVTISIKIHRAFYSNMYVYSYFLLDQSKFGVSPTINQRDIFALLPLILKNNSKLNVFICLYSFFFLIFNIVFNYIGSCTITQSSQFHNCF